MYVYVLFQQGIEVPRAGIQGNRDVYVGVASNVQLRLKAHNSGKCKATRGIQWRVVAEFECQSYNSAFIFERWLKAGNSRQKRLTLVAHFEREGSQSQAITEMETKALHWSLARQIRNPLPVRWK